jgi:hypothetical protein
MMNANRIGRPPGRAVVNQTALRRAYVSSVEPCVSELLGRGVEQALNGDSAALAGVLSVVAAMAGGQPPATHAGGASK